MCRLEMPSKLSGSGGGEAIDGNLGIPAGRGAFCTLVSDGSAEARLTLNRCVSFMTLALTGVLLLPGSGAACTGNYSTL